MIHPHRRLGLCIFVAEAIKRVIESSPCNKAAYWDEKRPRLTKTQFSSAGRSSMVHNELTEYLPHTHHHKYNSKSFDETSQLLKLVEINF